ncbi:MAG TPA: ABC transporter permease, partial [Puia sp.]|nr:ABC transporter permease [Puia sp.]
MVKYYFRIFRRNFAKNKTHFLLNLLGLTLGITCFLLALLFVFYENNYDSYVQHKDRIARIVTTVSSGGKVTNTALSNGFLTAALPAAFPEVTGMVRFLPFDTRVALRVRTKGDDISLENIYYADSTTFRIFSYPLVEGDRRSCLSNPNSIVLSKKIVKKIFGTTAVINRTVLLNNKPLKVTGVVEDLPGNSDLAFDGLISMNTVKPEEVDWVYTYVLFNSSTARDSFQTKLDKFTKEKINPEVAKQADLTFRYKLEPMGSIHFSNNSVYDTPKGDRRMVNIFLITGILILVIACTNSINMMVVRSFSRATETTIQKIYGASRRALITQQVIESVAVGVIATIFSFLLIGWLLPQYAIAIDRKLSASDLFNKRILASVLAALVTLGVSGAIYAAFYLQKIQLADILRSGTSRGYKMKWVSRLMLGFQFFISMGMMVAALVVHRQVTWLKEAPLGFNPNNVLVVDLPQGGGVMSGDKYLKNSLRTAPGAVLTSLCGVKSLPGGYTDISVYEYRENGIKVKKTVDVITADADYFKVLQVPIINGSNFYDSRDSGAKKIHVIVTNLMAKKAG